MDCSLPGSSVPGDSPGKNTGVDFPSLLQRIFLTQRSNPGLPYFRQTLYHLSHQERKPTKYCVESLSYPTLCDPTRLLCPWGFSRQEYWSGLPCPALGDLPNPGINLGSPALQADSLPAELPGKPPTEWKGTPKFGIPQIFGTRNRFRGR